MPELRTFSLPGAGLQCLKCQATLPRVANTRTTPGFILRERICPKCGEKNITSERVVSSRGRKGRFGEPCE